ncbi:branched-chain amino acid ABC transporter permease [Candidatus Peregrinibacteria bacterium]|jgi:branched-chain amino acid transport system permease protein|nr:branched-chain amino acid ABC transporter permease [Candidatus Peregrinibacteria bacterium]
MFFLQILINSIVLGTQILFIAIPLYLIYSVTKTFHLAIGATGTALGYFLYFGISNEWNTLSILGLFVIAAILLSILSYALMEPHIRKKQTLLAMLISFALGIVIESGISMYFGTDGKIMTKELLPVFHLGDLHITFPGILIITIGIISALLLTLIIKKTPIGRQLRSISENIHYSESLGVKAQTFRISAYIIASLFAGFSGVMTGLNTALTPYMGFHTVILAFIAFLIGGTTDLRGTIVASYIIALIPQFIMSYSTFSSSWKMFFVFIIAAILLILRPHGLFVSNARKS